MDPKYIPSFTIKSWAEEDRPREKLLTRGRSNLTDAELLAILLRSGSTDETAVGLAKRILANFNQDLGILGKSSINDLTQFKGVGEAKALTITAALELGKRRQLTEPKLLPQIRSSKDAYLNLATHLTDLPHEEFWILLLNRANRIIRKERISIGGVTGTVVDAKLVFRKALDALACAIILAHNHPSGQLQASQADLNLTKKLKQAGKALDIEVLDHLILTDDSYLSFADEGMI